LKKAVPRSYQTENYLVDESKKWVRVARFPEPKLPGLCDQPETLWINGHHSTGGSNDRIPVETANAAVASSLLFIRPERFKFQVGEETLTRKRKVRAEFSYNGALYNLTVTDPLFEKFCFDKDPGEYALNDTDVFLCISLGEPYEGYCYKLAAAVITR
jgi:hypothetical protein